MSRSDHIQRLQEALDDARHRLVGRPIEVCHIVDGGVWGYPEDCSSKWHEHTTPSGYVTRYFPGTQVCYVKNDPATWDAEHLGKQREWAVSDSYIDADRKAWRLTTP